MTFKRYGYPRYCSVAASDMFHYLDKGLRAHNPLALLIWTNFARAQAELIIAGTY